MCRSRCRVPDRACAGPRTVCARHADRQGLWERAGTEGRRVLAGAIRPAGLVHDGGGSGIGLAKAGVRYSGAWRTAFEPRARLSPGCTGRGR